MKNRLSSHVPKTGAKSISGKILLFWKTILWIIVILVLSFLPGSVFENMNLWEISFSDLIVHFFMYAVLTFLILLERKEKTHDREQVKAWWMIPLVASAFLGIITEVVQWLWIAGRAGSIVDFFLDLCGSATVILLFPRIRKII